MENKKRSNLALKFLGGFILIGLLVVLIWVLSLETGPTSQNQKELMSQKEEPVSQKEGSVGEDASIILPQPNADSEVSIEKALLGRRSVREYKDEPLTLKEVSQVLWAAQGITAPQWGGRTAPSAGALYPLEVYLMVRKLEGVKPGVYRYLPKEHKLNGVLEGDVSADLAQAALGQTFIGTAPVSLVFTGVFERTTKKYGERGILYVYMEAGHAAQNVYLQVQSLGLGTVTVGAFHDEEIQKTLNLSEKETPLYIMPVGRVSFYK